MRKPTEQAPNNHTVARFVVTALLCCLAMATLGSCAASRPAAAAEEWFLAVNSMDALRADELTCGAEREQIRQELTLGGIFVNLGQVLVGDLDIQVDASKVKFRVVEDSSTEAIVEVIGEFRAAVGTIVRSKQLNERWRMVREDGEWRWCGRVEGYASISPSASPPSTPEPAQEPSGSEKILDVTEDTGGYQVEPDSAPADEQAIGTGSPPGLILHKLPAEGGGSYAPRLLVRSSDGKEVRQIPLPGEPFYVDLVPSHVSNRVLVSTESNGWLVADASDGSLQELGIPLDDEASRGLWTETGGFRSSGAHRYIILASTRGQLVYLIDPESAVAQNLVTAHEDIGYVWSGRFSPDQEHLVILADSGIWLLDTNNPGRSARLLCNHHQLGVPSFSADSTQIVHSHRTDDGKFEVIVDSVDGSESAVVLSDDNPLEEATFVPGKSQLLLGRSEGPSLLSLADGQERQLMEFSSRYFTWFAPNGRLLLVGAPDERGWHLVDLAEGTHRRLDALEGFHAYFRSPYHRWLHFRDSSGFAAGVRMAALDLETGHVHEIQGLSADSLFPPVGDHSVDAERGLMQARTPDGNIEYWLVKAEEGQALLLASGPSLKGDLSDDGVWLVYEQWHENSSSAELTLINVDSGETRTLGEGSQPIWIRP